LQSKEKLVLRLNVEKNNPWYNKHKNDKNVLESFLPSVLYIQQQHIIVANYIGKADQNSFTVHGLHTERFLKPSILV
jgi:hypothetical protein